MGRRLKQIGRKEFIKKVLEGERDFSFIELEEGCNLSGCEGYEEMQWYLRKESWQKLKENPLELYHSELKHVKAIGLYAPYVKAEGADFRYANLSKSDLSGGNFKDAKLWNVNLECAYLNTANFEKADLKNANLSGTILWRVKFHNADLWNSDLKDAYLSETYFIETNLRDVINLEKSRELGDAIFHKTKVTSNEKEIIEKAWVKWRLLLY